ncbi:MarR family winged helix-turn-helix transcriptional regulator [Lapillicoccus jejuensis]|uniref:DNA-binding MarR family transcriptional regulator n=1 Tax=Lapillicoccus jejuensis TaxID=402171 RepID=A0A542E0P7_9MICO|nr:MarR family transcriptional regulator [Lapillicoccus jejuensis]TQJ08905.1 DNA-binding MarR family transcriptional regulator [Lapillicoccus jejuensis]
MPTTGRPGPRPADTPVRDPALQPLPGWQQTSTLTALQTLIDAASTVPAAVARRAEVSASELHALRHLSAEPLGPAELAHRLGVTTAAASGVVDRLVAHGHVERRPHPSDGRRTVVVLTDGGRTEAFARLAPMFEALARLDGSLSDEERAVVDRYLAGATAAIRTLL